MKQKFLSSRGSLSRYLLLLTPTVTMWECKRNGCKVSVSCTVSPAQYSDSAVDCCSSSVRQQQSADHNNRKYNKTTLHPTPTVILIFYLTNLEKVTTDSDHWYSNIQSKITTIRKSCHRHLRHNQLTKPDRIRFEKQHDNEEHILFNEIWRCKCHHSLLLPVILWQ